MRNGHFPGGTSIGGICTAHRQYDCWDAGSTDNARMLRARASTDPAWFACYGLALFAEENLKTFDNVGGAVFYHDESLQGPPSVWGRVRLTVIHGHLKFYAPEKES
jgi:hypothetical protein